MLLVVSLVSWQLCSAVSEFERSWCSLNQRILVYFFGVTPLTLIYVEDRGYNYIYKLGMIESAIRGYTGEGSQSGH